VHYYMCVALSIHMYIHVCMYVPSHKHTIFIRKDISHACILCKRAAEAACPLHAPRDVTCNESISITHTILAPTIGTSQSDQGHPCSRTSY
jgi:hypothetical protein